jgi:hypothetical protein
MNIAFDIVIPVGPNDTDIINRQIEFTKANIVGYRKIYIISCNTGLEIENCSIINESIFPFSIDDVRGYGFGDRSGWYLQQLLKLYAGFVIPDILERYLVIDSDTLFLKPTTFIDSNGKCLYATGTEYNKHYFTHMEKLSEKYTKVFPDFSGICHHMMFEVRYITEIFEDIRSIHGKEFWKVFLECVDKTSNSGASEYETYFNYIFKNHEESVKIRHLSWKNCNEILKISDLDFVSYHFYMR